MKVKIKWAETIIQHWELEVEVESIEEATEIYESGNHITGNEYIAEESFLDSELQDIEEIED